MKIVNRRATFSGPWFALAALSMAVAAFAHGGGNWNEFTIDRVNDTVYARIVDAQQAIANLIRQRSEAETWPAPELQRLRDELVHHKEEADEILEHLVNEGNNLQAVETIRAQPRIGRSIAASGALNAALALIDRASGLESQAALIAEFYAQGPTATFFQLVDAHRDRMDLYGILMGNAEPDTSAPQ